MKIGHRIHPDINGKAFILIESSNENLLFSQEQLDPVIDVRLPFWASSSCILRVCSPSHYEE